MAACLQLELQQDTSCVTAAAASSLQGNRFMYNAPILVTKAIALWDGLQAAIDIRVTRLQIEGDNRIIIQAVKGKIRTPWRIQVLIRNIHNSLMRFTAPTIRHIFCEGNMVTN